MGVQWKHIRNNNTDLSLTLEEIYRRFGAISGVHDFSFNDTLSYNSLSVVGITGGEFTTHYLTERLPPNFSIKYHKTDLNQGIRITQSDAQIDYFITTDDSGYPKIYFTSSLVTFSIPDTTPEEADVEIVFRQQILDDVDTNVWRSITIYMNGKWITTHSDYYPKAGSNIQIGFLSWDTNTTAYSAIRVAELCDIAEFGTIDPGESPMGGLQRTIEGRYLKMLVLFDGSLRAWKKKQRDQVMEFTDTEEAFQKTFDIPSLMTHIRMMGAYIWSEAVDTQLIKQYGHRFAEIDNSMLLTEAECSEEAQNSLKRSQEDTFTMSFQAQHVPILEPEDRILVNDENWIINDYSLHFSGGKITSVYNCRKYVWGT